MMVQPEALVLQKDIISVLLKLERECRQLLPRVLEAGTSEVERDSFEVYVAPLEVGWGSSILAKRETKTSWQAYHIVKFVKHL